jgi:hypothetical protein
MASRSKQRAALPDGRRRSGEPRTVTGATTTCTELDAGSPSPAAVTADRPNRKPFGDWRRHAGSHGSVKLFWIRGGTNVLLGRPCRQGEAPVGPMLDPDGCLARSAMRTQPSTEETGAVRTQKLEATNEELGSWRCQKNCSAPLTTGRLMGVTVIAVWPVSVLIAEIRRLECPPRGGISIPSARRLKVDVRPLSLRRRDQSLRRVSRRTCRCTQFVPAPYGRPSEF